MIFPPITDIPVMNENFILCLVYNSLECHVFMYFKNLCSQNQWEFWQVWNTSRANSSELFINGWLYITCVEVWCYSSLSKMPEWTITVFVPYMTFTIFKASKTFLQLTDLLFIFPGLHWPSPGLWFMSSILGTLGSVLCRVTLAFWKCRLLLMLAWPANDIIFLLPSPYKSIMVRFRNSGFSNWPSLYSLFRASLSEPK